MPALSSIFALLMLVVGIIANPPAESDCAPAQLDRAELAAPVPQEPQEPTELPSEFEETRDSPEPEREDGAHGPQGVRLGTDSVRLARREDVAVLKGEEYRDEPHRPPASN